MITDHMCEILSLISVCHSDCINLYKSLIHYYNYGWICKKLRWYCWWLEKSHDLIEIVKVHFARPSSRPVLVETDMAELCGMPWIQEQVAVKRVSLFDSSNSSSIGATTQWDPWDVFPPTLENLGTNCIWSAPSFEPWLCLCL